MAGTPLALRYRITLTTPLALLPGQSNGASRLRGGTIKGAVRQQAGILVRALGLPPCRQDGEAGCLVCRLFGAPGREAALRWSDALAERAAMPAMLAWEIRARRAVGRALGASISVGPTVEQAAASGAQLLGGVEGWLPEGGATTSEEDLAFLCAALLLVRRVGGGQGAGFGGIGLELLTMQLGEEQLAREGLLARLPAGRAAGSAAAETERS